MCAARNALEFSRVRSQIRFFVSNFQGLETGRIRVIQRRYTIFNSNLQGIGRFVAAYRCSTAQTTIYTDLILTILYLPVLGKEMMIQDTNRDN